MQTVQVWGIALLICCAAASYVMWRTRCKHTYMVDDEEMKCVAGTCPLCQKWIKGEGYAREIAEQSRRFAATKKGTR